jgi:hypothetical protein
MAQEWDYRSHLSAGAGQAHLAGSIYLGTSEKIYNIFGANPFLVC